MIFDAFSLYKWRMDIRHLRYFTAVADEGSVTKAASRLNLSQPALSRQIHALQDELGLKLFEYVGRGIQLTPQGQDLLALARRVIRDMERFRERAGAFEAKHAGVLRVASTPQTIESVLADCLAGFLAIHREVEVQFVEGGATEMAGFLKRGEAELVVTYFEADQTLKSRHFYKIPFFVVVPPGHRFAGNNAVEVRDLTTERIMALQGKFGSRALFESACRLARVSPAIYHESSSAHTLVALAAAGHGVAVIPGTVKIHREDVHLAQLHFNEAPLYFDLFAAWNPANPLPPYGHAVIEYLADWFQRQRPMPML